MTNSDKDTFLNIWRSLDEVFEDRPLSLPPPSASLRSSLIQARAEALFEDQTTHSSFASIGLHSGLVPTTSSDTARPLLATVRADLLTAACRRRLLLSTVAPTAVL